MTKYLIRGKFKMSAIFILKKNSQKTQIFHVFKESLFRNGQPYRYECSSVLREFCGLSKMHCFAAFLKIYPNLCQFECQKVHQNSTTFKK